MRLQPRSIIVILRGLTSRQVTRSLGPLTRIWKWSDCTGSAAGFHNSTQRRSIFPIREQETFYDTDVPDVGQAMEAWFYDVNRNGQIKVRSTMDVHIQPLNPQKHPKMDKLFINMMYLGEEKLSPQELTALTKKYIVSIDMDEENRELEIFVRQKADVDIPALCHLQIPLQYGIDVSCDSSEVTVSHMEAETVQVKTLGGNCIFNNVKSGVVNIESKSGNVISPDLIQGNVSIRCGGTGEIRAGKLQGQKVVCQTHEGNIKVNAVYADKSYLYSSAADIHLCSLHGNSDVGIASGNLTIDTLDGNLKGTVTEGDIDLALSREGNVKIYAGKGDISLKVPKSVNSHVELTASEINTGEVTVDNTQTEEEKNLTKLSGHIGSNSADSMITAKTKDGKIQLGYYSWLSSLNLTNPCS